MEAGGWDKVSKFVEKQLELLNDERDAEIEQTRALQEGYSPKVATPSNPRTLMLEEGSEMVGEMVCRSCKSMASACCGYT
jgi:hypothetical protein